MLTGGARPGEDAPGTEGAGAARVEDVLEALDVLVEEDAEVSTVLQRVATLLGRGVGVVTADGARLVAAPAGEVRREAGPVPAHARRHADGLHVWLEGEPGPREELLLRRFGVTVKAALRQPAPVSLPPGAVLFDPERSAEERLHAARRLGVPESAELTAIGVQAADEDVEELATRVRRIATTVKRHDDGNLVLLIAAGLRDLVTLAVPVGSRTAVARVATALELPEALRIVRLGLRYTLPATHDSVPYQQSEAVLVDTAFMGGYALLPAYLTPEQIDTVEDVRVLDELRSSYGPDMLVILEAVAATDSVRKAARSVHMHHNSVAHRVERAEQILGFRFTEPYGRTRLFLALCLRRIRDSATA